MEKRLHLVYLIGSYGDFFPKVVEKISNLSVGAYCENSIARERCRESDCFYEVNYLYDQFELVADAKLTNFELNVRNKINISEILLVDKYHLKNKSACYQEAYINGVLRTHLKILRSKKYLSCTFLSLETVCAFMLYRLCALFNIEVVMYSQARFIPKSFFSRSHFESINSELVSKFFSSYREESKEAEQWVADFAANRIEFIPIPKAACSSISYRKPALPVIVRFFDVLIRKFILEKHNPRLSISVKFRVYFQKVFQKFRYLKHMFVEQVLIKSRRFDGSGPYVFFPLHFSPESSINIPAPYFIDQMRVIDLVLTSHDFRGVKFVVKEHPAMLGTRPLGFYLECLKKPNLFWVAHNTRSKEFIRNAEKVVSVTGTASLEAFFLGVKYDLLSNNILSDAIRDVEGLGLTLNPESFFDLVNSVCEEFILYSPGISRERDRVIFADGNIVRFAAAWEKYLDGIVNE